MSKTSQIIDLFKNLNLIEMKVVRDFIKDFFNNLQINFDSLNEAEKNTNGLVCPHCNSTHYSKNGHKANKSGILVQRFICKDCHKSFTYKTNTITHSAKLDMPTLEKYFTCMMSGMSVRNTAAFCGISKNTSFFWRHKILDALQNMMKDVVLDGIVEADETFFNVSYKGNHAKDHNCFVMPRKSHKRGKSIHKRGLSREKICVPCAVNRNGLSYAKISNVGRVSSDNLHAVFDDRIKNGSVLVTDVMNSYQNFATENNLTLVQIKGGRGKKGIYHIQHINSYHSTLKVFIEHFKGVSSKYLNNYLVWNNFVNYSNGSIQERKEIFMRFTLTTKMTALRREQSLRENLPVLPTKSRSSGSTYISQLATKALSLGSCS